MAQSQSTRLHSLRQRALDMMEELAEFHPHLTGAVFNGTAGKHSHIHLQLFTENVKAVEICLLNQNKDISVTDAPLTQSGIQAMETIHFQHDGETFHLSLFHPNDQRKMVKATKAPMERAGIDELKRLLETP